MGKKVLQVSKDESLFRSVFEGVQFQENRPNDIFKRFPDELIRSRFEIDN